VRALLHGIGVHGPITTGKRRALGAICCSSSSYTGELIALGENDTLARRDEVVRFFGWQPGAKPILPKHFLLRHAAA